MGKSKILLGAALLAIFLVPTSFAAQKLSDNERILFDAANNERAGDHCLLSIGMNLSPQPPANTPTAWRFTMSSNTSFPASRT